MLEFDKSLGLFSILFRYSGMSLESRKRTPTETIKNRCLYLFNFFWLHTDTLAELFWIVVEGLKPDKNFTEITFSVPCFVICILGNLKGLCLVYYEDTVNNLVEEIRELENERQAALENKEKMDIATNEISFLNLVIRVIFKWNICSVVAAALNAMILMWLVYLQTSELHPIYPYPAVYPFDSSNTYLFFFFFIHQFWSSVLVILQIGGADCLYYTCCTYVKMHFRLLQYDVEHLVAGHKSLHVVREDVVLRDKLHKLLHWHQRLIRCVDMMEIVYAKSMLFNFVTSSFLICLSGFNATASTDMIQSITAVVFLSMNLVQIFLLSFYGDMIMTESTKVNDAAYRCQWYLCEPETKSKVYIMNLRAQTPCKLTVFGFADVNLTSFTKVLSTAWSYFALLQTIFNSPRT